MSGTETNRIPNFLEGEILPAGYFDPVNPYISAPTGKHDIGKLAAYVKKSGKTQWDLTKEELKMFETVSTSRQH